MKRSISFITALIIALTSVSLIIASAGNPEYASGVTSEMCVPSYWYDKGFGDADKVLMTADEIAAVNQAAIDGKGTYVFDIYSFPETYDADKQKENILKDIEVPGDTLYISGEIINKEKLFADMTEAIKETGYSGTEQLRYAVCTGRADLKAYPIDDLIGYDFDDYDDEFENAALCINEPFVIMQKCDFNGETFYWGYSWNCTGWINAKFLGICENKEQWLDAVKTDIDAKDFIVVTQDKFFTEIAYDVPDVSQVKITFGAILKLVPDDEIPDSIGERSAWNNYVVYLPVRDENGAYSKQPAFIPQHWGVNVGFLPFTQKNLLDVAFGCLGNRYGWAGAHDSMDCSLYIRNIYRCFGFELPRNTTWQQKVPETLINMNGMTDEQKQQLIETLPIGTALYFSGHTMMYIGSENSTGYVISDLGSAIDGDVDPDVRRVLSVALTPLTVQRKNGYSWLHNLTGAVVTVPAADISDCRVSAITDEKGAVSLRISCEETELYEGINYTAEFSGDTVSVNGINNFKGTASYNISDISEQDEPGETGFFQKIICFFKRMIDYIVSLFSFV